MSENFSKLLQELYDGGLSDSEVARRIKGSGVSITQPAITRIRNGQIKHPRYELGVALKLLYTKQLAAATKRKSLAIQT
jgi:hypothetical protein